MYTLITAGVATKMELEEYYTLDEALKLYSIWQMQQDLQACKIKDSQRER